MVMRFDTTRSAHDVHEMWHHSPALRGSPYPSASSVLDLPSVVLNVMIICNDQDPEVVPELAINWCSNS